MKNGIALAACLFVLALYASSTRQSPDLCDSKTYEDHNQIDPKPLKVAQVQGTGVIQIRDQIKPNQTVPDACLTLFTTDQKFVATTKADLHGDFQFTDIAPGQYRLVARAPAFCTTNIPIQIVPASRKSKLRRQQILVHYRVSEIDSCSWGSIDKAKD